MLSFMLFALVCICSLTVAVAAQLSNAHFFASTINHEGQNKAVNLQMTESGTCTVTSFEEFDYTTHQNGVWDSSMRLMRGYSQDPNGSKTSVIRTWASNGTDIGAPVPIIHLSSSPLALFIDGSGTGPTSLLAFSVEPPVLSRIDIDTGAAQVLVSVPPAGYSWIVPSGAFDASSALVYQVSYTVNATGCMALSLLAMPTRAPFSHTYTPLSAADASIAALLSASGLWGLAVAQAGKSLVAVVQLSAESNILVSIDATSGAVTRLGAAHDVFAGAGVMGSVLSSNGLLFVDTLDSTETTNRLHAFDALTGTLLASSVCAGIFNIDDFVAFSRD
jgi:hypothetical protein